MPAVSVIVPVYNVEKYLKRCVDSILNQTFTDFELILVDDGSTDSSSRICDEYAESDERVGVIHKENGGVSAARNTGIDAAQGEFIMFVDSDDKVKQEMLEKMLNCIGTEVDLIVSSIEMHWIHKQETRILHFQMPNKRYNPVTLMQEYSNSAIPTICLCGPCCKLYKRSVILQNSIKFDTNLRLGEDTCFNMDYIRCCGNVVSMSECFYCYMRENENSLFTRFQKETYRQSKIVFLHTLEIVRKLNCGTTAEMQLELTYARNVISNLIKAVKRADKKTIFQYMQDASEDSYLLKNHSKSKNNKRTYLLGMLLLKKRFYLAYYLCKAWIMIRR